MAGVVRIEPSSRAGRRGLLQRPRLARWDDLTGYIFLLPALAGLLLFSIAPLFYALFISLQHWDAFRGALGFVGLENYQTLAGDATFWRAMRNTAYYALWQVPLQCALALGLAMLIRQPLRGIGLFRAAYYLPVVISMVVASALWRIILDSESGLVNSVMLPAPSTIVQSGWSLIVDGELPRHLGASLDNARFEAIANHSAGRAGFEGPLLHFAADER